MKKLTFIFIFFSIFCSGQNWQPINSTTIYNYFSSTQFSSASIIKTDSSKLIGSDSVLYLNLIVKPIAGNSNYKLKNQGQFLGKKVVKRTNGIVTFMGDTNFTLKINSNIGDTWLFDTVNNITASTVLLKNDSVMGQLDSVKLIVASNSDTIILSKNYGISYYKKNSINTSYTLKGIQNLNIGLHVFGYKEVYDYNIGDIFEYRIVEGHSSNSIYNTYTQVRHYKSTILTKTINGNKITYSAQKISSDTLWAGYMQPPNIVHQTTVDSLKYIDSAGNILYSYNHKLFLRAICYYTNQFLYKQFEFGFNALFNTDTKGYSDASLSIYSGDSLSTISPVCHYAETYGEKFGLIYGSFHEMCGGTCSNSAETYLIGSKKGGITFGQITPDSIFYSGIENKFLSSFAIFPTLTEDKIFIKNISKKSELRIYNMLGDLMYTSSIIPSNNMETEINVSSFSSGTYLVKLLDDSGIPYVAKFIKN